LVVALIGAGGALGGCGDKFDSYATARAAWARTKETCPDYHYTIVTSSFSGYHTTTTVDIAGGQPVGRQFSAGYVDGATGVFTVTSTWAETAGEIGVHQMGAPAETMDQLYDDCRREVLGKDRSTNMVYFHYDERGVLMSCAYTPVGCQDDCVIGVGISDFACGAAVPDADAGGPHSGDAL